MQLKAYAATHTLLIRRAFRRFQLHMRSCMLLRCPLNIMQVGYDVLLMRHCIVIKHPSGSSREMAAKAGSASAHPACAMGWHITLPYYIAKWHRNEKRPKTPPQPIVPSLQVYGQGMMRCVYDVVCAQKPSQVPTLSQSAQRMRSTFKHVQEKIAGRGR